MAVRTWKKVGNDWRGYGNGFKSVIYGGVADDVLVEVVVFRLEHRMAQHYSQDVQSAKRWAERNYLKAKNF